MAFELLIKDGFLKDYSSLDTPEQKKVPHATKVIRNDPFGGGSRKVLTFKYKNLYRYRFGDYRLLYSVGTGCVALLAIGHRSSIYRRFQGNPEGAVDSAADLSSADLVEIPTDLVDPIPDTLPDGSDPEPEDYEAALEKLATASDLLRGLLSLWDVPGEHRDKILECSSPEEILELDLDPAIIDRVLHIQEPPSIQQILEQPTYELRHEEELNQFAQGTFSSFLLRLDAEQQRAVDRSAAGPLLIRGGPGTGKSIIALHRIRNLYTPQAQKELWEGQPPKVLFVTYTRALTNASRQMLTELIGPSAIQRVRVGTLDQLAWELAGGGSQDGRIPGWSMRDSVLEAYSSAPRGSTGEDHRMLLNRFEPEFLAEEFDWVIDGMHLKSLPDYSAANRRGRGIGLPEKTRSLVWSLYEAWQGYLGAHNTMTYTQVQREAYEAARKLEEDKKYDVVVVDEAQDLKPVGIRLALLLAKSPEGFFMTADAEQSIYGRGFSWKGVSEDLQLQGRSVVLQRNYRCTKQVQDAAVRFLQDCGLADSVQESTAVHSGPKPVLRETSNQAAAITARLKAWSRELRLPIWMSAVLVRTHKLGLALTEELRSAGLECNWFKSSDLDLEAKCVKVMTLHTAKGLEFPMVAIAGLEAGVFPTARRPTQDEADYEEQLNQERRLFHVGMSRAMRRLLVTFPPERPSEFVADLRSELWDWEEDSKD